VRRLARRECKFIRILRTTLRDSQAGVELTNQNDLAQTGSYTATPRASLRGADGSAYAVKIQDFL
jgi:hypothetical protein